jgi:SAM-dependent methyltransferase
MRDDAFPPENVYGHVKRLRWIASRLPAGATVIELGCGTGYMITRPLLRLGLDAHGVDLDAESVRYGREILRREGLRPEALQAMRLESLSIAADAVIASEVLEHVPDAELEAVFRAIRERLKPGGVLLVTVPNGRGWFEVESFLWFKFGLGRLLEQLGVVRVLVRLKRRLLGAETDYPHPSTLAESPHVRFFTYRSIQELVRARGFEVTEIAGSVLFCGPFSNLLFTGISPVMRLNIRLGACFPRLAAGFFLACRPVRSATPHPGGGAVPGPA